MQNRNFMDLMTAQCHAGKYVCVGLDSAMVKLPESVFRADIHPQYAFNASIVDATADLAGAYKLNLHFYLSAGPAGYKALIDTVNYIKQVPGVPVILDYKTGDIGNSNEHIAQVAFDLVGADAATFHTYTGSEAMEPILRRRDKGVFLLARTSNEGADEFQAMPVTNLPNYADVCVLWSRLVDQVRNGWNKYGNCGFVFGATQASELRVARKHVGDLPLLIPGVGAQGGDLQAVVRGGIGVRGSLATINSSRAIIFASDGPDFADAARKATQELDMQIRMSLAAAV